MKRFNVTKIILVVSLLALPFFFSSCGQKEKTPKASLKGVITFTKGQAFINGNPAKTGKTVQQSDVLRTQEKSMLVVQFSQKAIITIRSNSLLRVQDLQTKKDGGQSLQVFMKEGTVFNKILRKEKGKDEFQVYTPSAVAGVRGTSFSVTVKDDQMNVRLLKGKVALRRITRKAETTDGNKEDDIAKLSEQSKQNVDNSEEIVLTAGEKIRVSSEKVEKKESLEVTEKTRLEEFDKIAFADDQKIEQVIEKSKEGKSSEEIQKEVIPEVIPPKIIENIQEQIILDTLDPATDALEEKGEAKKPRMTIDQLRAKYGKLSRVNTKDDKEYIGAFKQVGGNVEVQTINGKVRIPVGNIQRVSRY